MTSTNSLYKWLTIFLLQMSTVGHAESLFQLAGEAYANGDYASAVEQLTEAAEQGNVRAQADLGTLYSDGDVIPQNMEEAFKWFSKAATQGYAPAQFGLGVRYHRGEGVLQDHSAAIKWYIAAAEQGNVMAAFNLGRIYNRGEGTTFDIDQAIYWYKVAANLGELKSQSALGFLYYYGEEARAYRDRTKAIKWNTIASQQGDDTSAQFRLGMIYSDENWGDVDMKTAAQWYKRAADKGHSAAQSNLGIMYAIGQGIPQDYVLAHMWFNLASANGDKDAVTNRDSVSKLMSNAQIQEAQKLARERFSSGS